MNKQFVTYEIALKLKELGFNEKCLASYYTDDERNYGKGDIYDCRRKLSSSIDFDPFKEEFDNFYINSNETYYVSAPLWQQVQSFLDDNGVIIGIIFVDNVFKYTLNTNNYVSNGFKDRMSAIKSATEHATNYLWDKKFNK